MVELQFVGRPRPTDLITWISIAKSFFIVIWAVSLTLSTITASSVLDSDEILVVRNHTGMNDVFEQTECIASFSPLYTITSATISFIIPGIVSDLYFITLCLENQQKMDKLIPGFNG